MFGHWFILASQSDVKIFTQTPERIKLRLVKALNNPLAKLKTRDLHRKTPGVTIKTPHEQAALQFAREVSRFLQASYGEKKFKSLTIAAEPKFLGKIKSVMKPQLQGTVVDWIEKNLLKIPDSKLPSNLKLNEVVEIPV